ELMAFPTTPEETLKYYLFKVMSEEDATRFMSLKEVLAACEEEKPKWQAVYALSVHLHVLGISQARPEFRDYVEKRMVELESCIELHREITRILPTSLKDAVDKAVATMDSMNLASIYCAWASLITEGKLDREKERLLQFLIPLCRAIDRAIKPFRDEMRRYLAGIKDTKKLDTIEPLRDKISKDEFQYEPWWQFLYSLLDEQSSAFSRVFGLNKSDTSDAGIQLQKEIISDEIDAERYPFVGYAKLMAANTLIPILLKQNDYEAAIGAMTKVVECLPTEEVFLKLEELVDKWLNFCETSPLETDEFQWVGLIDRVSTIAEIAREMPDESIDRCFEAKSLAAADKYSEDFWAWKFGYIVGRLALAVHLTLQKGEIPLGVYYQDIARGDWLNGYVVASLLFGCDPAANYFPMWLPARGHQCLTEVAPTNGLYWAMRVGFADAVRGKSLAIVLPVPLALKEPQIGTVLTYADLRQLKDHETLNTKWDTLSKQIELLPALVAEQHKAMFAWPQDMEPLLQEALTVSIFASLPLPVRELLKDSEAYYRSKNRPWGPNMALPQAVEETLNYFFIAPLTRYYGEKWVQTNFVGYRTQASKWGAYFLRLCSDRRCRKSTMPDITPFFSKHVPSLDYNMLFVLGQSLKEAAERKNILGHSGNSDKYRAFIELRELAIVSKKRPSVLQQIVELFGNKRDTAF
ncbi:MAG: hypothetical protein Q7R34_07165, partial [Dehalococcoidia bacterium]|nr:hypothetical protein [Dehalococcoidia bacterium]